MNSGDPVANDRQRQVQERRRLHQVDTSPEIELDDPRLDPRFLRAVNQVEAIRCARTQAPLNPVDCPLDRVETEARRAEDPQHARPAHRLHDFDRTDSVCHRPGHACIASSMGRPKTGVTQVLQLTGRHKGRHRVEFRTRRGCGETRHQVWVALTLDDRERSANVPERFVEPVLVSWGRMQG